MLIESPAPARSEPALADQPGTRRYRAIEFFAGVGLVRRALTAAAVDVVWANDIDPIKKAIYEANWGSEDFVLGDVHRVSVEKIPGADLATASFPCTDLSLAGNRRGLAGVESGTFWGFIDVLEGLKKAGRLPPVVMCENVSGFATSKRGDDLRNAVAALNSLGYSCDLVRADARWWLPQSRERLFMIGAVVQATHLAAITRSEARPQWMIDFWANNTDLSHHWIPAQPPLEPEKTLRDVLVDLPADDERWWDKKRLSAFRDSLSFAQTKRLLDLQDRPGIQWRTAYRRTRAGIPRWEMRQDEIAGCLRTARGGSSKQAVARIEGDHVRVRWMLPEEYAALQGAEGYKHGSATINQMLFGFGDAVCVPAVEWIVTSFVRPHLEALRTDSRTSPDGSEERLEQAI